MKYYYAALISLALLLLAAPAQASRLNWPVQFAHPWTQISSPFGPRLHAADDYAYEFHAGIDIAGESTDNVVAAAAGEVYRIYHEGDTDSTYPNSGNVVILKHATTKPFQFHKQTFTTYYTLYFHLDSIADALAVEDAVSAGTILGTIGQSGVTEFNHLHFEVRIGSTCSLSSNCNTTEFQPHVNPLGWLNYPNRNKLNVTKKIQGNDVILTIISKRREVDLNKIILNHQVINFNTRRGSAQQTTNHHQLKPAKFSTRSKRYKLTIRYFDAITPTTEKLRVKLYDVHGLIINQQWNI